MKKSLYEKFTKRFLDIVLSFLAIIILLPLFLIVSLLSFIFMGRDIILKQYRPGKNGKIFTLYKFRTMKNLYDENGDLLPDEKRFTKYGKILRKTSLDELPQLFNILKGDMSIVGPRPRLIKDMIFYDDYVLQKAYSVRPGLTGPAQVYDRCSVASWEEVFRRDIEYAEKITFWNDLKMVFGTVKALFTKDKHHTQKRDYYYCDYLLKSNLITKEQYDLGLSRAKTMNNKSSISYSPDLHKNVELNETTDRKIESK